MLYRNKKLLEVAKDVPICFACGSHNGGDVVAAHSNQLRDGKGKGIKSHDFRIAFLCSRCHYDLDQGATLTKEERKEIWEAAHRETIGWLFNSGHIKVL